MKYNRVRIKILLLGEMMSIDNASFRVQLTLAKTLAQNGFIIDFVYPTQNRTVYSKTKKIGANLRLIETAGILPPTLRRGGFGFLDLIFKIYLAITGNYNIIHATCGHRPAQFIPAICGKLFRKSVIIDEWWEWYGTGGRSDTRKGLINGLIGIFDRIFEIRTKNFYNAIIAISSYLKARVRSHPNVIVLNGGAEIDKLIRYEKSDARKMLNIPYGMFIVGITNVAYADHNDNKPFLQALIELTKQYANIRLFVTGEKRYIEDRILKSALNNIVIYNGWLNYHDYNMYLCACDIFVLPLSNTPRNLGRWPHKLGDYICVNRPIITNPTGDLVNLFTKYKLGMLCENNKDTYISLFRAIMSKEIDLISACADSKFVAENILSIRIRINNIIKLYQFYIQKN